MQALDFAYLTMRVLLSMVFPYMGKLFAAGTAGDTISWNKGDILTTNQGTTGHITYLRDITSGNAGNILVLINNNVKGRVGSVGEVVDSFIIDNNFNN